MIFGRWGGGRRLIGLVAVASLSFAVSAGADTATDIRRIVEATSLESARVTYYAVDLETGAVLAERDSDRLMIPASNMKLLTTGAALVVLGPDFSFETRLFRHGKTLVVAGSGDPALGDPDLLQEMELDVEDLLRAWVDDVVASGLGRIDRLIVDDTIFEDERIHPRWPRDQLNRPYCAEVSGFNFFFNCVAFYAGPSQQEGLAPWYRVEPDASAWLPINNKARTTTAAKGRNSLWATRASDANRFTLSGHIRVAQETPIYVTLHDPSEFFARLFAERLRSRGIEIGVARTMTEEDDLVQGTPLGRTISTPMPTILRRCNQDSKNLYAEALFKRMGHEVTGQRGSWANGAAILRMVLVRRLGATLSTKVVISDGSGMSRENRVTPEVIVTWLKSLYDDQNLREPFVDSLAVGGINGTLRKRFNDSSSSLHGTVRAKSGYLNGVSCLSGYVVTNGDDKGADRAVAFAILINDIPTGSNAVPISRVKQMQERMVKVLDEYLAERVRIAEESAQAQGLGGM